VKLIYPVGNVLERLVLRLFADYKVMGVENVPPMGPLLIVANHQSNFDPPLLGASIPRRIWFPAKANLFRRGIAGWFLRSYGAFPLNRERVDIRAIRWMLRQIEHGGAVAVFPEGTRSNGALQKGNPGVAQLALMTGAPLLPVGIVGTERFGTWMRALNPTGTIRVNVGSVFSIPSIEGKPSKEVHQSITDMIMYRIAALLPERYQGVYRVKADRDQTAPAGRSNDGEGIAAPPT
jgi:1-acyl-sn-glycerol-3-phosphate acyltransferase